MKKPVVLFGEGKADEKFLRDFIKHHFGLEGIKYIDVRGKDSIHLSRIQFEQNTDQGGVNLLLFDADGDFKTAINNINKQKGDCGIKCEIFLFPNNHDKGALEELLLNLTVPAY